MTQYTSDWTLDVVVRCSLSISEARLITSDKVNVIAGRNGCGKSQLLSIISDWWRGDGHAYLKDRGYRNFFAPASRTQVAVRGPRYVYHIVSTRSIAKDRDERNRGAYTFEELAALKMHFGEDYRMLRKALSKLAYDATAPDSATPTVTHNVREGRRACLAQIVVAFSQLFPGFSLDLRVDSAAQTVSVFGRRTDMNYLHADDAAFGEAFNVPFATFSDGELNALFLLYQVFFRAFSKSAPTLLLIDELDSHLHPALHGRIVEILQASLPSHAMILATTHSPQVVAALRPESRLLMIHSSELSKRNLGNQLLFGRDANAGAIMHQLYGASSKVAGEVLLRDYQRAARGQTVSYAEECLTTPRAVSESLGADPQRVFLAGLVQGSTIEHRTLRVLDVGAGRGRLFKGLCSDFAASEALHVVVDAVEPHPGYRRALEALAPTGSGSFVRGTIYESIQAVDETARYDIVLLHNVVHEVWALRLVSLLRRCGELMPEGAALNILEMEVLPEGEDRFFVFSGEALGSLVDAAGFATVMSRRQSHSGIPIIEMTGRRDARAVPDEAGVATVALHAAERSIANNVGRFRSLAGGRGSPLELAFLSMNIAFGEWLVQDLSGAVLPLCPEAPPEASLQRTP